MKKELINIEDFVSVGLELKPGKLKRFALKKSFSDFDINRVDW